MRVRCDRDSRAEVYLLLVLKTLGKLGKNVWRSLAMQGLDPNKISTYSLRFFLVRTRSTSVKKERLGFPSRDLIDTNPRFMCQLMRIFSPKTKELTTSLLIA